MSRSAGFVRRDLPMGVRCTFLAIRNVISMTDVFVSQGVQFHILCASHRAHDGEDSDESEKMTKLQGGTISGARDSHC